VPAQPAKGLDVRPNHPLPLLKIRRRVINRVKFEVLGRIIMVRDHYHNE
jgi:hypothetical protein